LEEKDGADLPSQDAEEQKQILRLTTPDLHPTDEDLSAGTPGAEKRSGPHSHPSDEDLSPGTPVRSEAVTKFVWRGCLGAVGLMLKVGEAAKIGGVEVR